MSRGDESRDGNTPEVEGDYVTASDFVRNFADWQERAKHKPVFILHHGKPRLVMASLDQARRYAAPLAAASDVRAERDMILEAIDDIVILADSDGTIRTLSREARAYFSVVGKEPVAFASIFPEKNRPMVEAAIERVARTALTESLEIRAGPRHDRRLEVRIQPCESHLIAVVRDRTLLEERALAAAQVRALQTATKLFGGMALARVGANGYIQMVSPTFVDMTGLTEQALLDARFVTLAELGSRVAVAEAIDGALNRGEEALVRAELLTRGGDPVRVRIAISPMLEYALAVIIADPA